MKVLLLLIVAVLGAIVIAWIVAPVAAFALHAQGRYADEIEVLQSIQPLLPFGSTLDSKLDRLHREQVERELRAGRIDKAVQAMRVARRRMRRPGAPHDDQLVQLGLETYTRAADRVRRNGRLSAAADWFDTLFVFAVRDPDPHVRSSASAAFLEGLDLRVQDGKPCAALAHWRWAERGLGGSIPDVSPLMGTELESRCARAGGTQ